jgi:ketosteroid isomerase-like protein
MSPKGRPFKCDVAEFWRAKDGMLVSVSIYFDTAAFGASVVQ